MVPVEQTYPPGGRLRAALDTDREQWLRLRGALWPDCSQQELAEEIDHWLASPTADQQTLVIERPDGALGGFIELSERSYAEGCETSPVAYIEGWYVDPDLRRQGWGAALVGAAEAWARQRGRRELASGCELDNLLSLKAHRALGFSETARLVALLKPLS